MGQGQTGYVKPLSDSELYETRANLFALWPGLEYHLELSFNSLDLEREGLVDYETLEPALRHHLLQIGLIEYITRFVTSEGALDLEAVESYLASYKLDVKEKLDIIDWKNLMLAWICRVQQAQQEDIERWQTSLKERQEEQAGKYKVRALPVTTNLNCLKISNSYNDECGCRCLYSVCHGTISKALH